MIEAIVYTSNTGTTAAYAKLLNSYLGLPALEEKDAEKNLNKGTKVLYLGWLRAGSIVGYKKANRRYDIGGVCAVGMGKTGTQEREVREKNRIPLSKNVFVLQGGFDLKKLHGVYKFMMNVMVKMAGKALQNKPNRTEEDEDMLDLILHGGSRVSAENLQAVLNWYDGMKNE